MNADLSSCARAGVCLSKGQRCSKTCERPDPTVQDEPMTRAEPCQDAFYVLLWVLVCFAASLAGGLVAGYFEELRTVVQAVAGFVSRLF